jgi:hypothetical protein
MAVSVSSAARGAVLARLADAVYGFNANHADAAAAGGAQPIAVNWNPATSKQLFLSFLSPDAIEDTTAFTFPVVCVYSARSASTNRAKYNVFSGEVHVYVDIHWASKSSAAPRDSEREMDAIENALIACFNARPDWAGDDVVYGGDIELQRLPVTKTSSNWRQTIRARLTLELDSN